MHATKRYWEDVEEGDTLPEVRVDKLTRTDFVKYAGASGDFNPIHHDQTFAEASRKLEQGGEKLVEGELEAINQKGETLIGGSFVAALPSRA